METEAEASTSTAGSSNAVFDVDLSGSGSAADSGSASPALPPLSSAALALAPPPPLETLPIANISRIMRRSLPDSAKIGKDAKEAVQIVLSEFISFVTSEANERCLADRRKTISGDDLLTAFRLLGLDEYHEVLRIFLTRYRMAQEANPRPKRKRGPPKRKASADAEDGAAGEDGVEGGGGVVEEDEDDDEYGGDDDDE
ncbi:hypothetical protein V8E36_008122 [Tilletia maclaganii]